MQNVVFPAPAGPMIMVPYLLPIVAVVASAVQCGRVAVRREFPPMSRESRCDGCGAEKTSAFCIRFNVLGILLRCMYNNNLQLSMLLLHR